jgi:activator of HSP90 ATPase
MPVVSGRPQDFATGVTPERKKMKDASNLAGPVQAMGRRQMLVAATAGVAVLGIGSLRAVAGTQEGVSRNAESIHQEPVFKATAKRVYEALADAKQFEKVVRLSAAMQSGMALGNAPVQISREAGGAFTLFGGHIVGRQVELVPNERIVQAWRVATWNPGVYSIARFELTEQGSSTKLVFEHVGFPEGQGQHLAEGWKGNYWEPLEKYLR